MKTITISIPNETYAWLETKVGNVEQYLEQALFNIVNSLFWSVPPDWAAPLISGLRAKIRFTVTVSK